MGTPNCGLGTQSHVGGHNPWIKVFLYCEVCVVKDCVAISFGGDLGRGL